MKTKFDWSALLLTILLIIVVREFSVWLMSLFGHPELGNLIGLGLLLIGLILVRRFGAIPLRMIDANAYLMRESALAFLPIAGGSILMLFVMGEEIPLFLFVMVFSTLVPLWIYAKLAKRWL